MNLIGLINELNANDQDAYLVVDKSPIGLTPCGLDSYRGYYEDLAIVCDASASGIKVAAFIKMLEASIGTMTCGYKGGEFLVSPETRVWISNYGEVSNALVTGVRADMRVYLCWDFVNATSRPLGRIRWV